MPEKKYNNPNITISKVFTKKGDSGKTELIGKKNVYKDNIRIDAYGELDELNVIIGGCCKELQELVVSRPSNKILRLIEILELLQNKIFNLGNMIATIDADTLKDMPQIDVEDLKELEKNINNYNDDLPTLSSFVLPGGSNANIWFNLSRTVSRKCERIIVKLHKEEPLPLIILKYINRVSDAFFVWGRWINFNLNIDEKLWNPNKGNK